MNLFYSQLIICEYLTWLQIGVCTLNTVLNYHNLQYSITQVRVYGPGIEHGVLATFQSRFICDTRGAGAGQLTVRVRGPKGAFRVEMQRETQKDRIILCRYDPTEPGDYRVEVRWAGVLVPGSPFPVRIVDTQDELLLLTQVKFLIDNHS